MWRVTKGMKIDEKESSGKLVVKVERWTLWRGGGGG